jgi:hypothetical protein
MGQRPGVHDGGAAVRRAPDRGKIQQVIAVNAVVADDIMTEALQVSRYWGTHVTAMPRNQNPHDPMIGRRPAGTPTDLANLPRPNSSAVVPGSAGYLRLA